MTNDPKSDCSLSEKKNPVDSGISRNSWILAFIILAIGLSVLAYELLTDHQLEQTAALFVGIPTILAVIIALTPKAKTSIGMVYKGITIGLLVSIIALKEGIICILMAAPLFYLVGLVVGVLMKRIKAQKTRFQAETFLLILFSLFSLEGVSDSLSLNRYETVQTVRTIQASSDEIVKSLKQTPRFNHDELPLFFKLGFPTPSKISGSGLRVNDIRRVRFEGGEGKAGDLIIRVKERGEGYVVFDFPGDESHIAHWLEWIESRVQWKPLGNGQTEIQWSIRYKRLLDPAWYFGPMEHYAMTLVAEYLVESLIKVHGQGYYE